MSPALSVHPYRAVDAREWDALVSQAAMATFLHSRRFLAYHGDRFEDASVMLRDERGACRAVLPAALDPRDPDRIVSHPGATYGGIVHDGRLAGQAMLDALAAIAAHYRAAGRRSLRYKAIPAIYHRAPSDDDLYALWRAGAVLSRCDLSSAFPLAGARRPRSTRRAELAGVTVTRDDGALAEWWPVLERNLGDRHGARPTHTLAEILELQRRLPGEIAVVVGRIGEQIVAGALLFVMAPVVHLQYTGTSDAGRDAGALDAVLEHAIALSATLPGAVTFDFGISTEDGGRVLNDGLNSYKRRFGGSGALYAFYDLAL